MAETLPIRTTIRNSGLVTSRREQIARSAMRIMVHKGFEKVSTQEVADACGMTVGSLYRYIGTKDDIIYLIMQSSIHPQKFCDDVDSHLHKTSAKEALVWAIDRYYRLIDEQQDVILFAYQETKNMNLDFREVIQQADTQILAAFNKIVEQGRRKGEFSSDDPQLIVEDIVVAGQMWAVRRWYLRRKYTLDKYIQRRIQLTLKTIENHRAVARH